MHTGSVNRQNSTPARNGNHAKERLEICDFMGDQNSTSKTFDRIGSYITNMAIYNVHIDLDKFKQLMVNYVQKFNKSDNIIYYQTFLLQQGNIELSIYKNMLYHDTKFRCTSHSNGYSYSGDNPAEALNNLINMNPLLIECTQVRNLVILCAFRDLVGNDKFNTYVTQHIMRYCNNELNLTTSIDCLPLLMKQTMYYTVPSMHGIEENTVAQYIKVGDLCYVGIPNAGARITNDFNGYNVTCVGFNQFNEPLFLGFEDNECEYYKLEELKQRLNNEVNKNFTYQDLLHIDKNRDSDELFPQGTYTYKQVYVMLSEDVAFAKEIEAAKNYSTDDHYTLYLTRTSVAMPDALCAKAQLLLHVSIEEDANHDNKSNTQHVYQLPTSSSSYDTIVGYIPQNNVQEQFSSAIRYFADLCINDSTKFHGFFVYGSPGVGKTHCCDAIYNELCSSDKNILAIDNDNREYAGIVSQVYKTNGLLNLSDQKTFNKIMSAKILEACIQRWVGIDVFYLNDIGDKLSDSALITQAVLRYARENGKQVLINSGFDPIQAGIILPTDFIGDICIQKVIGGDYRKEQLKWHEIDISSNENILQFNDGDYRRCFELNNNCAPTVHQCSLANEIHRDIGLLEQYPKLGVLTISGEPGIGKTTMLRSLLNLLGKSYKWIGAKELCREVLNLQNITEKIVIFDDVNFQLSNPITRYLFEKLFTTDYLYQLSNKNGEPLAIIIITNEKDFNLTKFKRISCDSEFRGKIDSRASQRMKVINTRALGMEDFRIKGNKYGAFLSRQNEQELISVLKANESCSVLNITNLIHVMDKNVHKNRLNENLLLVDSSLRKVMNSAIVILEFDEIKFNYQLEARILIPILDNMEDNSGNTNVYLVCDNPAMLKQYIINVFKSCIYLSDSDKKKYLSRLERLNLL